VGSSAEQVVFTVLAQFPDDVVKVTTTGNVRQPKQIDEVLQAARSTGGLVVHTLVDPSLRAYLVEQAQKFDVPAIDLMGPLTQWLSDRLGKEPLGQPGLYRHLHREYFDRVSAIDYTMAHDDGKNPDGWPKADMVLAGVSRVGKTPLSLYLAVLGWKVANVPFVPQIPMSAKIFSLDPKRVFGLTIEPGQLIQYRRQRQQHLGVLGSSAYMDPVAVHEEIQEALKMFRRGGFSIVDMTDKTIELGADEIIRRIPQEKAGAG